MWRRDVMISSKMRTAPISVAARRRNRRNSFVAGIMPPAPSIGSRMMAARSGLSNDLVCSISLYLAMTKSWGMLKGLGRSPKFVKAP